LVELLLLFKLRLFFVSPLSGMSISKSDFTHNNMVPFFGGSVTQSTSESATNPLLETFTGNNKYHIDKKERTPLFNPQKNMYHIYGTPNMSSDMYDRMIPSRFKTNESPIEKQNVGPGLIRNIGLFAVLNSSVVLGKTYCLVSAC
jgi:hypothetical protein